MQYMRLIPAGRKEVIASQLWSTRRRKHSGKKSVNITVLQITSYLKTFWLCSLRLCLVWKETERLLVASAQVSPSIRHGVSPFMMGSKKGYIYSSCYLSKPENILIKGMLTLANCCHAAIIRFGSVWPQVLEARPGTPIFGDETSLLIE